MAITEISVSKIYVLATEPTNKIKDRFWFDTTNNLLKRYDGTSWKTISISSDDVVVLSNGNKISLTSYLNTQIAALAEGIDSKQDKLYFYTEKIGNFIEAKIQTEMGYIGIKENTTINAMNSVNIDSSNGDTNIGTVKYDNINASTQKYTKSKLALKSTGITLDLNKTDSSDDSNIIDIDSNLLTIDTTDTEVTTLSGSLISNSISSNSSDYKLPTEKAVYDAVSGKQDKLKYYSESEYDANITNNAGDIYISTPGGIMGISANTITLGGNINGDAIHTAISSTPSDDKLLTEKAISTSLSSKQDKLTTYKEMESSASAYDKQVRIDVDGGIHINGGEVGTVFENQFQIKATAGQMDLTGDWFYINADNFCLSAESLSGSSTIVSAISSTARDNKIPTEKAVADAISNKQNKLSYYKESNGNVTISPTNGSVTLQANNDDIFTHTNVIINDRSFLIEANNTNVTNRDSNILTIGVGDGSSMSVQVTALSGALITTSINSNDTQLPTSKAVKTELDKKQAKLTTYTETPYTVLIGKENTTNSLSCIADTNISLKSSNILLDGETTLKNNNLNIENGKLNIDGVDVLSLKQNSTDDSLNTTNKTIVGAINELLSSINTNVITSTEQKRITTTSTSAGIQMSTTAKTCMVSINPVKTNVGAIYISTSSDTAPTINPLYPDQMPKYKFPDASQVYIWSDVNGDSVDLTIEYYG